MTFTIKFYTFSFACRSPMHFSNIVETPHRASNVMKAFDVKPGLASEEEEQSNVDLVMARRFSFLILQVL